MAENQQEDDAMFQVPHIRRRLDGEFGRPSCLAQPPLSEHMKVYLRIRPFSEEEVERNESQGCLDVESECVLKTVPPKDSHYYKEAARRLGKTIKTNKYTFSHIFKEETSQRDFFNSTTLNLVKDFIDGQNCLVYSYGVTSSGKTYTIQGEPDDAGLLPRALDVLFNSINGRQLQGMSLKPDLFMGVTRLTPEQELYEQKVKEQVMKMGNDDDMDVMSLLGDDAVDVSMAANSTISSNASISSITRDFKGEPEFLSTLNDRVREETKVSVEDQGQIKYSVWVSFAEIYNEQIFDLLEVVSKKKNTRRTCLKLGEDQNGSPYIKGLKNIQVSSADEAYRLLTIGQRNLKTACTKLNQNSSRSHCIYNIRILRFLDKENPHASRVSMLSFCDLAGSERYAKTNTQGERLKEAGNINTSLMTLGRCIETLRYNQSHKDNQKIIPFRDSKLTRLFQNYFVGRGKAVMIVNVNQLASMFDETQHVFKFSAIASQVITKQKPSLIKLSLAAESKPLPRSSIMWASEQAKEQDALTDPFNVPLPEESDEDLAETSGKIFTQEDIDELLAVIDDLQKDLDEAVKSKANLQAEIRNEVCDEMMKQFSHIEMQFSENARAREQRALEMGEKRIQIVMDAERAKRKQYEVMKDQDDEWVSSLLLHQEKKKVEERNTIIKEQKDVIEKQASEIEEHKALIDKQADEIKALKAKVEAEDDSRSNLIENLTQQLQEARDRLSEQETEVAELNDMLTEAGETFSMKETEIEKLKELNTEYEKQLESLKLAYSQLERVAGDSKVAMENADQSLSKREDFVSNLQSEIRAMEGTKTKSLDIIPESPLKPFIDSEGRPLSDIDRFRKSVCELDLSNEGILGSKHLRVKSGSYQGDSSGVVADCDSEDLSDDEVQFKKPRQTSTDNPSSSKAYHHGFMPNSSNFKANTKDLNQFIFHKPLNDSRVLQVVLSPLKSNTVVNHTKSSILRLKNSPAKDPTRGRECVRSNPMYGKRAVADKRKCASQDENEELDTSKRRKRSSTAPKNKLKIKRLSTSKRGQKYNLRSRR